MNNLETRDFLETMFIKYCHPDFIVNDPISIPHLFTKKEDIEIAAFLSATLAWGQRVTIISKGKDLMTRMDHAPYDFISNASERDISTFASFVHRTFQGEDCMYFMYALQRFINSMAGWRPFSIPGTLPNTALKNPYSISGKYFSASNTCRAQENMSPIQLKDQLRNA